jgi:cytoskeleton protein RodZ
MINLDEVQTLEGEAANQLSLGKVFLQSRLQAGLTQLQVAKELFLTVSKVQALEADDYNLLGADAFVRGYIRAYAIFLKLNEKEILARYEQQTQQSISPLLLSMAVPVVKNSYKRAGQFIAGLSVFFILLWLLSVWFIDDRSEIKYVQPSANISSLSVSVDNLSINNLSINNTEGTVTAPNNSVLAEMAIATSVTSSLSVVNNTNTPVQANTVAEKTEVKKKSLDEINFAFRGECWLEVSDSRGDVLATELQAAGSKLKLVGQAPFEVKLGNARAAAIKLNGKKVDVVPLIDSKVLTLQVGN